MKRALLFLLPFIAGIATDRFLAPTLAQAQTGRAPSLTIDDATLSVGMSKTEAVARLSNYTLSTPHANGRSTIVGKPVVRDGINHFDLPGSITFNNGVVTEVTRNWGGGEQSPEVERLWKSFWGVVNSSIPVGQSYVPLSMRAYAVSSPESQSQTIDILVGAHHVVSIQRVELLLNPSKMLVSPPPGGVWNVSVDETVF
jgi:hypothetical protein